MNLEHYESPLDAYLDGQMTADERAAFEARIAESPELRAEIELQREIDAGLLRNFQPPTIRPELTTRTLRPWWLRVETLAIAATFVVAAVGLWRWYSYDLEPPSYWAGKPHSITAVYRFEVSEGLGPDWVCDNDQQFAGSLWARFEQPLILGALPAGTEALGLAYSNTITPESMHLLAKVEGVPVVVFIDRADADPGQSIGGLERLRTGLRLYSRTAGDLVLYEVSPLDQPHLLEYFEVPDGADPAWLREGARQLGIRIPD